MAKPVHRPKQATAATATEDLFSVGVAALLQGITGVPTNPRTMKPGELCRTLNSTPLGEVITTQKLGMHRQRAGLRIGDGKTIDLLRYTAWLCADRRRNVLPSHQPTNCSAVTKRPVGSKLTREEERAIAREEQRQRQEVLQTVLRALPKGIYCQLAQRQQKVVDEQGYRYRLPLTGPEIDLGAAIKAFHDLIAKNAGVLTAEGDPDAQREKQKLANENLRLKKQLLEFEIAQKRQELVPRVELQRRLEWLRDRLRAFAEQMGRRFGRDTQALVNDFYTALVTELTNAK